MQPTIHSTDDIIIILSLEVTIQLNYVYYVPMWFKNPYEFEPHRNIGHIVGD